MASATIEMKIRGTVWLWVLSTWLWSASRYGVPLGRRGVRWLLRRSMVYRVGGGPWKRVMDCC